MFRASQVGLLAASIIGLCPLLAARASAQVDSGDAARQPDQNSALVQTITNLSGVIRKFGGWETLSRDMNESMDRAFERAGWDSEEDLYALNLVHTLNEVPPWDIQKRLDLVSEALGERYQLDEDQRQKMMDMIVQSAGEIATKHSDKILTYLGEFIQTRGSGDAVTPEQVARWTELATPVFEDATRLFDHRVEEFSRDLPAAQRELLERDLKADRRRQDQVRGMMEQWRGGKWKPEDWGLDRDAVQQRNAVMAKALSGDQPPTPTTAPEPVNPSHEAATPSHEPPEPADEEPDDENDAPTARADSAAKPASRPAALATTAPADDWARYVQRFIQRFSLDDEQSQRAWQFYRESTTRKDEILERARKTSTKPADARTRQQVDRAFDQLKLRLERLPTRAQRNAAGPEKPAAPGKRKPSPR